MKTKLFLLASAAMVFALTSCNSTTDEAADENLEQEAVATGSFKAVDMPSELANGDAFPTPESTINGWIASNYVDGDGLVNNQAVIRHAWGLWQALTETTKSKYNGRNLRRYETWYTPQDVMKADQEGKSLDQITRESNTLQIRKKFSFGHNSDLSTQGGDLAGSVKYSPGMAQKALDGKYFVDGTLDNMIKPGEITTVEFDTKDVSLKPVYRVLTEVSH